MSSVLVVAEKPSAARNMAKALGGMSGTYQGTSYEIVPLLGHLYEFDEPINQVSSDLSERYRSWDLGQLPWDVSHIQWKRRQRPGVNKVISTFKTKARAAAEIVCATDVDPTGEGGLIFAEPLIELKITPRKMSRMYFTDEAEKSIQQAFIDRKEIVGGIEGFDEYQKALTRAKFDWLTQQFTRVATVTAAQKAVLRQGRLKSAMLLLVGEQLKAHLEYVKKPFFQNRFKDENGVVYTDPNEQQFPDEASVPQTYQASEVVLDKREDKQTAPPRLLDLAALSSRLSSKGIKADQVLSVYQKMYENQVVSYPRTEDKTITTEQFNELLPLADKIAAVVGVDAGHLTYHQARRTHVKDGGAHGANRPGPKVPASLNEVQQTYGPEGRFIYEELARSFLAMLADDYKFESQQGFVKDYPTFRGSTTVPKSLGWKHIFDDNPKDANDTADGEDTDSGQGIGTRAKPFVSEGSNKRPPHPSMKWLMAQLEKRDVGTGATRTSTFAELTKPKSETNRYPLMNESRGKVTLTEYGEMGFRVLPGTRIGDLGVTEHVYQEMREVAAGKKTADDVIGIVGTWVSEDIETMQRNAAIMRKELGLTEQVIQREKVNGVFAPTGLPVTFHRDWAKYRFTDEEVERLLKGETINVIGAAKADGSGTFDCHGKLDVGEFNGKQTFGFQLQGFGTLDASGGALPPKSWCGYTFSQSEYQQLCDGEKVFVDQFVSKKGNTFAATVHFGEEDGKSGKRIIPEFGN